VQFQTPDPSDFYVAIAQATSRGLHDAAQPLTVVQGLLELTLMQAQTVEEHRNCLNSALAEISRVMACFENVRQLVRLQQPAPDVCEFSISQMLKEILAEMPADHNITLACDNQDVFVLTSVSRTRQALSLLISGTFHQAQTEISISSKSCCVAIRVQLPQKPRPEFQLAQLLAASAGGRLSLNETNDSICLELPEAVVEFTDQKGKSAHV
jgi:hypothetical protein